MMEDCHICFIYKSAPSQKAAFSKGRKELLRCVWSQSLSWPEQNTSAEWCDPFMWVLLVLACGGGFLSLLGLVGQAENSGLRRKYNFCLVNWELHRRLLGEG